MSSILYISYDGMTDPLGQSQVLPYLQGLSKLGYQITLLSCEKPERSKGKDHIATICRESNIEWHPIPYNRKPPILSTIKDVAAIKRTAEKLHKQKQFDIVHCRSYISALAGQWMQKRFRIPFVFDMRGFWADERVDGGLWNLSNPLYKTVFRYFKQKEKQFLSEAAAVVSLTHAAKSEIENWPLKRNNEISVIPCCVDTKLFNNEGFDTTRLSSIKSEINIPANTKVLGYVGSLGTWYQLPEMLQFFRSWLQQNPNSILLFVTTEPKSLILEAASTNGIDTAFIRIVSAQRNEVPYYISLIDYGLFFIKQAYSKMASSPVKQGEIMAMGKPVICNKGVGDSDRIVEQYQAGILVDSYDLSSYERALTEMKQRDFCSQTIRNGCLDYFDLDKGIQQYADIYESIMRTKN